ncbi:MAG: RNA polymerase sigma factor [Lachnospiraceae bacterium]|jgi:RNA polymerase sigma-70 factor (ECF subfamily)|nr:RNA polymerase sigma factor [Lachnospiraceae bacterium]
MKYAEKQKVLECYQTHKDMIYKLAWAYCKDTYQAEDVFQEVFYKYLIYHPKFKAKEHEKAWFIRTTINTCKNFLKSKWNCDILRLEEWDKNRETPAEACDAFDALKNAILDLPEKYRVPIHLYYYEEYSVREISHLLHKSESTIQTQLQRGREKIKQTLERSEQHDVGA